jgi:hypothetical protein
VKLLKETIEILKYFSTINTNLVIKPGKKIATLSPSRVIMAEYDGADDFKETIALFNLPEFLGAFSSFSDPEIDFSDKDLTIKEGKHQLRYVYAKEDILIAPKKSITMPATNISFKFSAELIAKMQKMSAILAAEDLAIIGNGKTISIKVLDKKNPTANTFEVDLEISTTDSFVVFFKMENIKLFVTDYTVNVTTKISQWKASGVNLIVYIAVETDSVFP